MQALDLNSFPSIAASAPKVPFKLPDYALISVFESDEDESRKPEASSKEDQIDAIAKEGWLTKEGMGNVGRTLHSWKRRWFIMKNNTLAYYTQHKRKLKGVIQLDNCSISEVPFPEEEGKNCMILRTADGRELRFVAESSQEQKDWIEAINNRACLLEYSTAMKSRGLKLDPQIVQYFSNLSAPTLSCDGSFPTDFDHLRRSSCLNNRTSVQPYSPATPHLTIDESNNCIGLFDPSSPTSTTRFSTNSLSQFSESIPTNCHHETIFRPILESVKYHVHLEKVSITRSRLSDELVEGLVDVLASHSRIAQMNLSGNAIGDKGAAALATLISSRKTLFSLDVSNNQITDEGTHALASALRDNPTLAHLDLRYNDIGDRGAQFLSLALLGQTLPPFSCRSPLAAANLAPPDSPPPPVVSRKEVSELEIQKEQKSGDELIGEIPKNFENSCCHSSAEVAGEVDNSLSVAPAAQTQDSKSLLLQVEPLHELFEIKQSDSSCGEFERKTAGSRQSSNQRTAYSSRFSSSTSSSKKFSPAARYFPTLALAGNKIGNVGAEFIAKLINGNPQIFEIDLTDNKIGNEGVRQLVLGMQGRTIRSLKLENNEIGLTGILELCELFKDTISLEEVSLGGNRLGDQALLALAQLVENDFEVRDLELLRL